MHTEITDEQIEQLKIEAGQAGDDAQIALCVRALDGDEAARSACVEAIRDAEAQA